MAKQSAGLLMYRLRSQELEVLLVHPGGPFWRKRDLGVWTIPKGLDEAGEDLFHTACREFTEETSLIPQAPFTRRRQTPHSQSPTALIREPQHPASGVTSVVGVNRSELGPQRTAEFCR